MIGEIADKADDEHCEIMRYWHENAPEVKQMKGNENVSWPRRSDKAHHMAEKDIEAVSIEVFEEEGRGITELSPLLFSDNQTDLQNIRDGFGGGSDGIEPDVDGTVEVRNGEVLVRGPRGRGRPAVIIPTKGVVLKVNGVEVHGPRRVREGDRVEVEPLEEVHPAKVEVDISSDGFTASIRVTPQVIVRHELVDQRPQNVLQLLTRCRTEEVKTVTIADAEAVLREKGVVYGIDRQEVMQAVSLADGIPRVVARGEPVQEGRDGWVEYLFNNEPVKVVYEDESSVDYWERYIFPSVAEGEVLAVVHPPVPGVAGIKVTGETVKPRPVREAKLRVRDGVVLVDNGRRAVAAMAGRPVLVGSREPHLGIAKIMVHPGDVDFKSGNVSFGGDLLILGSVREGMRVSAEGDITVMGDITGAVVSAGGRVMCQGKVINSRVKAGGLKSFYIRLAPLLKSLGNRLNEIVRETERIFRYVASRGKMDDSMDDSELINKIIRLLVEKRRKELRDLIEKYAAAIEEEADLSFPPVIREFMHEIDKLLSVSSYLGTRDASLKKRLERLLSKKEEITSIFDSIPEQPGDIICSYAQNSVLNASGSIVLMKDGGYFSSLTAGKDVRVRGVFRGGEISASGSVYVDEAGSPGLSGGRVRIRVKEDAAVYITKAYPETAVQVGGRFYCFAKEKSNVKVFLKEGELCIELL